MSVLKYKDYIGVFDYDSNADIFHGEVKNISDIITFEGRSIDELKKAIADSVEDYIDFCKSEGKKPQKPFSGRFNLRISPELHQKLVIKANETGKSLNNWVSYTLEKALENS